jgi:hypothetical protein
MGSAVPTGINDPANPTSVRVVASFVRKWRGIIEFPDGFFIEVTFGSLKNRPSRNLCRSSGFDELT